MKSKLFTLLLIITAQFNLNLYAQETNDLNGQVSDSLGSVIVGATVTIIDSNKNKHVTITNQKGEFSFKNLTAGKYIVTTTAPDFSFEINRIEVVSGKKSALKITLNVQKINEAVEIDNDNEVNTDADNNKSQMVLGGKDLDGLPSDPEALQAALNALVGGNGGPDGAQFIIDGFTNGKMPPKEAIREIRINRNPFSAEFERLGIARIEILTKPGTDSWRGSAFLNFNDESLNARNPFSLNRAASQTKVFGGTLSGPIKRGKSSFFLDANYSSFKSGSTVNATVLDNSFNETQFSQEFTVPNIRFSLSPRFDYQINSRNTLVARYSFASNYAQNLGLVGFSLPSRSYSNNGYEHQFQITETAILNPKTVNETRVQYNFSKRRQNGDNSIPTVNVSSAFLGGGPQVGNNFNTTNRWEIQNLTTTSLGKKNQHAVKFGGMLRTIVITDKSEFNYGGTFVFAGVSEIVFNSVANRFEQVLLYSSIEQYRQKLLGNPDPRFNPNQFTITNGNPLAQVSQHEVGFFISDDWKITQNLTLGFGVRYENQTNINDKLNLAPRFSFAWQPWTKSKTVIRGGVGVFYNRFGENNTLQVLRSDGITQKQFVVANNPAILGQPIFTLNGVSNLPTPEQIDWLAPLTNVTRTIDPKIQAPYTIQALLGFEKQLNQTSVLAVTYSLAKSWHLFRTRNINAPICPPLSNCSFNSVRPFLTKGNVYQTESSGYSNSQFLNVNLNTRFGQKFSVFSNYRFGVNKGDTDSFGRSGGGSFPAYSYELEDEYGYNSLDIRHNLFIGGGIKLPNNFSLNSFFSITSGTPFNIIIGADTNLDTQFTERPTFAQLNRRCQMLSLKNRFCNIEDITNSLEKIIPRNYGRGTWAANVNLSLGKTFALGKNQRIVKTPNREISKPYNFAININIHNLFNINNKGNPIANLSSPMFGKNNTGNSLFGFSGGENQRKIDVNLRFNW